jgi:hypothetical protein
MDTFLTWIIDQKYTNYLERFPQIDTPTIHVFTSHILESAIRVKNIELLTALLHHGVKFDNVLGYILSIGDVEFMKLVLSRVDLTSLQGELGIFLSHRTLRGNHFNLARTLVQRRVSVEGQFFNIAPLYSMVSEKRVRAMKFLLSLSASVNSVPYQWDEDSCLGVPTYMKDAEINALLVEHGANISSAVAENFCSGFR